MNQQLRAVGRMAAILGAGVAVAVGLRVFVLAFGVDALIHVLGVSAIIFSLWIMYTMILANIRSEDETRGPRD